ncbi:MAG: rhodanese-like domain-containing protein [Salinivirgaceae bacterium]|jgi:rhodanese-related sulfurtransferase
MKKTNLLLLGFLFGFLFLTTSCEKEETVTVNESEILADYLTTYSTTDPAMIAATDVYTSVVAQDGNVYVIDIRSSTDFAAGHITGAVNVTLTNLLTYYEANNLSTKTTVAIACYTGQTANYGASLLRMLGYTNVKALKFGMSSWNPETKGSWTNNTKNTLSALMETAAGTKNTAGKLPVLNTGKTTGAEILRARVETLLAVADPFADAKITNQAAYDNRATNYTVNYWKASHYNFKHLPGAVQYTPKTTMSVTQELNTLPADKTVVVYCYTGQTSAYLVAYLKVLGYDAKSLLYGANGMMYDDMLTYNTTAAADDKMSVFVEADVVKEFPLVTN